MSTSSQERHVHHGHNIKKFREMLGIKQEALAIDLGDDWTQKKVSRLEEKELVEPEILQQVANIFKVPVDVIKNYDSEQALNIISNTFNDTASLNTGNRECEFNFNPLEKLMEAVEENRRLTQKNAELYERILKEKDELTDALKKIK